MIVGTAATTSIASSSTEGTSPSSETPSSTTVGAVPPAAAPTSSTTTVAGDSLRSAVANTPIAGGAVVPAYDREAYQPGGWPDTDGDCINDRHEVLIRDSEVAVVMDSRGCMVVTGRWVDAWTGTVHFEATAVTIDHVVAISYAHRAGGWAWDDATKRAFAADLDNVSALVVVGPGTNQAKGADGPASWQPPDPAARCRFATGWASTMHKWGLAYLTVDDRSAILTLLDGCPNADAGSSVPTSAGNPPANISSTTTAPATTRPVLAGDVVVIRCDAIGEEVELRNMGAVAVSLSGYVLTDEYERHRLQLGAIVLEPGDGLIVTSGPDQQQGPGRFGWTTAHVWNNTGDTATLTAPDGSTSSASC